VRFCDLRHPAELGTEDIQRYLNHLVMERNVSAATQQQALSALLFLYRNVEESVASRARRTVWHCSRFNEWRNRLRGVMLWEIIEVRMPVH
jgi:hypothetical protein